MEPILAWIVGHPDITFVLATIWISTLLIISYVQHSTRRLELRMRVLIEGHMNYYRELNPKEFGFFVDTESWKRYCREENLRNNK